MLNMLFSTFAYIFWAQLLAIYQDYFLLTNCLPNLVFIYLVFITVVLHELHHIICFYIAMRENEIQQAAFMFWVHLLFFIAMITNITVCIKQTVCTQHTKILSIINELLFNSYFHITVFIQ